MKTWEMLAFCKDCNKEKIKRKDEWHSDYRCNPCFRKIRGRQLGEKYGKVQTKTSYYCIDCNTFLCFSVRIKRCNSCHTKFMSARFTGERNPAFKVENREYRKECNKIRVMIGGCLNNALKSNNEIKTKKLFELLDYSLEDFKLHLESLFQEGMTWENHGKYGWHIDHIVPVSWFIENNYFDIKVVNCLKNLQPLWAKDNLSKKDKCYLNIEQIEKLLI